MEKMTFREAQLCVLGAYLNKGMEVTSVILNNLQVFQVGDLLHVVEISLTSPAVVFRFDEDGPESYVYVDNLSETVVSTCIEVLREVAYMMDEYNAHI